MTFDEILAQVLDLLQRQGRVSYRALKLRFQLDDDYLEGLKDELIDARHLASDEEGRVLVWTGRTGPMPAPLEDRGGAPLSYTPTHLAEKILTSKSMVEGERKQVTVLFADLKGSMELLADRDPEEARQLLDPVLERMMEAVHRYEGTVNQVMGDGIMALFGAPIAREDHTVRSGYAALRMQETVGRYAEELRRNQGLDVQIRVGLNSGEVVVRAIGSDLRMDCTAVGQTTHLAARMEQLARPGTTLLTADTLRLVEGYFEVRALGPVPVKGLTAPMEVYELLDSLLESLPTARVLLLVNYRQVTVLFADIKDSTELIKDLDAEAAQQLLDPAMHHMMDAVHRFEGTVNQVLGDGIMALFGAPIAHEAYALRLLGEIAVRREPPERDQAGDDYRQALALAKELGMRPLVAHCRLGLGKLYATVGRRAEARADLSAAIALYRAMDMTFWLPEAEAALVRIGE